MKKSKKLTIAQKAKKAGIPAQTVYNRIHAGWHEKKALSVPVNKYTKKNKKVTPTAEQLTDYKVAKKAYKKAVSDFESIKPTNVKPKFVFNDDKGKVEPKKAPSPLSQRMNKANPIPIQKFEGKKTAMDSPRTVVVSLAVILVIVILVVVNA